MEQVKGMRLTVNGVPVATSRPDTWTSGTPVGWNASVIRAEPDPTRLEEILMEAYERLPWWRRAWITLTWGWR